MSLNGPAMMDLGHCEKLYRQTRYFRCLSPKLRSGRSGSKSAHCRNVAGNIWRNIIGTECSIPKRYFNCTKRKQIGLGSCQATDPEVSTEYKLICIYVKTGIHNTDTHTFKPICIVQSQDKACNADHGKKNGSSLCLRHTSVHAGLDFHFPLPPYCKVFSLITLFFFIYHTILR